MEVAKLIAVVVFPTPPFWLATAQILEGDLETFNSVIWPNYLISDLA
jgi:hypothetical protein